MSNLKQKNMKAKTLNQQHLTLQQMLFPVEKVKNTDYNCNSDYSHDIFAYPIIKGEPTKTRVNACSDRMNLFLMLRFFR